MLLYFLVSTFSGTHVRTVRTGSYASESASKILGIKTLVSGNIILGEMTLGRLDCEPEVQHVQGIPIKVINFNNYSSSPNGL